MPTHPLWDVRPKAMPHDETAEERRERRAAGARAAAAIRVRRGYEAAARLAALRKLETDRRLADEAAWRASNPAPTRTELEVLRKMLFPKQPPRRPRW